MDLTPLGPWKNHRFAKRLRNQYGPLQNIIQPDQTLTCLRKALEIEMMNEHKLKSGFADTR